MESITEDNVNKADEIKETPVVPSVQPTAAEEKPIFDQKDVEENKYVAALSYLGILFLVPLLLKKESPFAQFHAKQGLGFCVLFVVGMAIFWFPVIGWAAALFLFVTDVIALVKTLSGEAWSVPVVRDVVKKLNI